MAALAPFACDAGAFEARIYLLLGSGGIVAYVHLGTTYVRPAYRRNADWPEERRSYRKKAPWGSPGVGAEGVAAA